MILLLGVSGLIAVQIGAISPTGKPSRDLLWILGGVELSFYIWVRVFAGLKPIHQIATLVVFVAVQAGLYGMARLEGFTGDGRLILAWRWMPTPEQLFDKEQARRTPLSQHDESQIDLTRTTEWDSPAFRGADRSGKTSANEFATNWDKSPPAFLWRRKIGRGWSSFAVVGDYCVTQEQRHQDEVVVCYSLATGREIWVHRDRARFDEPTGGPGPRATPAIHEGRVYALGATGLLNCLDGSTGDPIWSLDVLADNQVDNRLFGMAGSPLIAGSLVIVSPGGPGSSLAAYDLLSGRLVWKGGDAEASYSSPQLASFAAGESVLSFNAEGLFAHDFATGEVSCSYPWVSNPTEKNNVCQPVPLPAGDERDVDCVFIASGYGKGCALLELRHSDRGCSLEPRWSNRNLKAKFSSVIVHEGFVYGLDGSIMTCIDLQTGEHRWKAGRYGYGQLILVNSLLLVQLESGEVALVEPSPTAHREMTRFEAISGRTWNYPVVSGQRLLVRNDREAACFALPQRSTTGHAPLPDGDD